MSPRSEKRPSQAQASQSCPNWLIGESIASGALERVLPDWSIPPIEVHVVFPSGKLPSRLSNFIDFAVEELPRGIQRLSALGRAGR